MVGVNEQFYESVEGSAVASPPQIDKPPRNLFPPSWLILSLALTVTTLIVLMGWKIVNLEAERSQLDGQRIALEHDKTAHAGLLRELPELSRQREELMRDTNVLKGTIQTQEKTLTDLNTRKEDAMARFETAKAGRTEAEAAVAQAKHEAKLLGQEIEQDTKRLQASRNQSVVLAKELSQLEERKLTLSSEVARLEAEAQGGKARLQALMPQVDTAKKELETAKSAQIQTLAASQAANEEQGKLANDIKQSRSQAQTLNREVSELAKREQALRESVTDLQKQEARVQAQLASLDSSKKTQEQSLQSLTKENARIDELSRDIASAAQRLDTARKAADQVVETLRQQAATLGRSGQDFAGQTSAFADRNRALGRDAEQFKTALRSFEDWQRSAQKAVEEVVKLREADSVEVRKLLGELSTRMERIESHIVKPETTWEGQ